MANNSDFYFVNNTLIQKPRSYDSPTFYEDINHTLELVCSNVRIGPPITGNSTREDSSLTGLYLRKDSFTLRVREAFGDKEVSLEKALELESKKS